MQTSLAEFIRHTPDGEEAEAILRKCVHCGFCTATCPTYQLTGDELDGPRGRIYLMKEMLEGSPVTQKTQSHLDRCLTCRNCETTCPSGVEYGRLVEIGRKVVEEQVARPTGQRLLRRTLASFLPSGKWFASAFWLGQRVRPLLPQTLRDKVPAATPKLAWPTRTHARKMLMLAGCVQPSMQPNINIATARVFDALGIQIVIAPKAGCCGAIRLHLSYHEEALNDARRNIDAWWPYVEQGAEAIVMNASGCGVTVKDYGHLLRLDPAYAEKAQRISELTKDVAEILPQFIGPLSERISKEAARKVAYHPPCTLQHGQRLRGLVEGLLKNLGIPVQLPADSHLCCGSAGTYSIMQPELSHQLRERKVASLEKLGADMIVSSNIGCICHLQSGTQTPVRHWIELLDQLMVQA
ncbi:glycolate oxidase subunit GlcF [Castellaniella sp. FW104-16D08]|uniref:glycolate oxidase subunit GlcF n=1 Tax=unclassified Castellaniella TaxID=2617606 RepID=UPI003314E72C